MQFASFTFLFLFLPLTLGLYYLTPQRRKPQMMLGISLLFVLCGGLLSTAILLLMTLGTYSMGRLFESLRHRQKLSNFLTVCLALAEFAILFLLRCDTVQNLSVSWLKGTLLFPLGLSFFILQSLDYCIAIQRGKFPAERSLWRIALYMLFYPRLIMGPVVSYSTAKGYCFQVKYSTENIGTGLFRFFLGLTKKLLLADWVSMLYTTILEGDPTTYSVPTLWIGAFAKLIALYLELSGYADMAIGAALCYGVKLPESYGKKFFSPTITQFAEQWNRTVVQWFFHFIGTRFHGSNRLFHVCAVILTWGCIGLWYDMRWTTLLCGMGIGLCIGIEYLLAKKTPHKTIRYIITILLLCLGTAVFAQPNLSDAWEYLQGMLGMGHIAPTDSDWALLRGYLLALIFAIYVVSGNWHTLLQRVENTRRLLVLRIPFTVLAAIALLLIDLALLLVNNGSAEMQLLL